MTAILLIGAGLLAYLFFASATVGGQVRNGLVKRNDSLQDQSEFDQLQELEVSGFWSGVCFASAAIMVLIVFIRMLQVL